VASLVAVTGAAEEAVAQALAAAYGNADVAAEYLINGGQNKSLQAALLPTLYPLLPSF
jgi:hypothetical protein